MKNVILSADGERKVFSVPDKVANNLREYCIYFSDKWLRSSPNAKKYRFGKGVCFNEEDFIDYLNTYCFPNEKSSLVENIGWINTDEDIPTKYQNCPQFNF